MSETTDNRQEVIDAAVKSIEDKTQAIRDRLKEAEEKARREARAVFTEVTKDLFDLEPRLQSFTWRQFTPYFNDGEECTFGVYTDYPEINGFDYESKYGAWLDTPLEDGDGNVNLMLLSIKEFSRRKKDENGNDVIESYQGTGYYEGRTLRRAVYEEVPNPNYDPKVEALIDAIPKLIHGLPADSLKALFGDHCQVTVYRDREPEVSEYIHD